MSGQYVILTAAKNEEAYIGEVIQSVLCQSVLPLAWLIMDDGSTDRTAQIVEAFAAEHKFILLNSASAGQGRNFGSQYKAILAGYELAREMDFEFVGVHDADIAPERADYYEVILGKFAQGPRLGIAGGYIYERAGGTWYCRKGNSPDSVAGGIQMFRRKCFEQIGGFVPLHLGGSDWLAQIDAKMAGWEVVADPGLRVRHYRATSSANGRLRGWFQLGRLDASFGSHPLFELMKCAKRVTTPRELVANTVRLFGYLWWKCRERKAIIPPEKVTFLRKQQLAKIAEQVRW